MRQRERTTLKLACILIGICCCGFTFKPNAVECYEDPCGGDLSSGFGMADFGQELFDGGYGEGLAYVSEEPTEINQLERIAVTGTRGMPGDWTTVCVGDSCGVVLANWANTAYTEVELEARISLPDLIIKMLKKEESTALPVPTPPVQTFCSLSLDTQTAVSTDQMAVYLAGQEVGRDMGWVNADAFWNVPLADGGIAQFQSRKGIADFNLIKMVKTGSGVAAPSPCPNMSNPRG